MKKEKCMRNQGKKVYFTVAACVLCGVALSACKKENAAGDGYTYRTYTAVSPSNWNELTSQDNNDRQILDYLTSPFFEYDFKRDESGKILAGEYDVRYSFATGLKDVSEQYGKQAGSAYAWEITVRDDGKWNDGTQIDAGDFVYSMQQLLDPKFKNVRADSYYNGALVIKNAKNYVYG
jgi:ABC-type transport system substrate-binding protein